MNTVVDSILKTFDELPPLEQREVATRILRRTASLDLPALSDDDLINTAEDLFQELDAAEAENGDTETG
jgi:hypothetical protein